MTSDSHEVRFGYRVLREHDVYVTLKNTQKEYPANKKFQFEDRKNTMDQISKMSYGVKRQWN